MSAYTSAGFSNGILYCNNVNFTNVNKHSGQITADGQLLIGNAVFPYIRTGTITSSSLTVGYSAPNITIETPGGGEPIEEINVQAGTTPVVPSSGAITFNGAVVVAGSVPVQTNGTAPNTMALEVQLSQAIASTNADNVGLAAFNSAHFSVDANGFVSSLGGGFPWIDQGSSTTIASNTGYFATAAVTLTLPASPSQGDTIKIICDTSSAVEIQGNTGQTIRQGTIVSSSAGTFTNTARGDALELIYRAATTEWIALNGNGTWIAA